VFEHPILRFGEFRFHFSSKRTVWPYYAIFFQRTYDCLRIRPDDVVLDAGANAGLFSIPVAAKCRKVIAVEPGADNFGALATNKQVNNASNVVLVKKALWDYDGYVEIGGEGLTHAVTNQGTRVSAITIDSLLRELKSSIDIVKMDIEGAEVRCLDGSYLENVREIVIETHSSEDAIVGILKGRAFRTWRIRFRERDLLAQVLRHLPFFVWSELGTGFMASRSLFDSMLRRRSRLVQDRCPQLQIIYGRRIREEPYCPS
jgi:FkbM family methyltransferase